MTTKPRRLLEEVRARLGIIAGLIGALWVVQIVNALLGGALTQLGVHPRTISGLWGILLAPFIHVGFAHLIANTIPLTVLAALVSLRRKRDVLFVGLASALVGGLGTWLVAPSATVHVGASILVFGYLGYLIARGLVERRVLPVLGSLAVLFLYGGALRGILPLEAGVSWQGHLFGLIGGILAARAMRTPPAQAARPEPRARIGAPSPGATSDESARAEAEATEEQSEVERELAEKRRRLRQ